MRPFRCKESKEAITLQKKGVAVDMLPLITTLGKEIAAGNPLFAR
jgi:hypothetical protein